MNYQLILKHIFNQCNAIRNFNLRISQYGIQIINNFFMLCTSLKEILCNFLLHFFQVFMQIINCIIKIDYITNLIPKGLSNKLENFAKFSINFESLPFSSSYNFCSSSFGYTGNPIAYINTTTKSIVFIYTRFYIINEFH